MRNRNGLIQAVIRSKERQAQGHKARKGKIEEEMRITQLTRNTFNKHYLSISTYEQTLQNSGDKREQHFKIRKHTPDRDLIKTKRFTSKEKKVTLP